MRLPHLLSTLLALVLLLGSGRAALAAGVDPSPARIAPVPSVETDRSCVVDDGAAAEEPDHALPSATDAGAGTTPASAGGEDADTNTPTEPKLTLAPVIDDEDPAPTAAETADAPEGCDEGGEAIPAFDASVACADLRALPSMRVLCALYGRGLPPGAAAAIERVIASHATKVAGGWAKKHALDQARLRAEQVEQRAEKPGARSGHDAEKQPRANGRDVERKHQGAGKAGGHGAGGSHPDAAAPRTASAPSGSRHPARAAYPPGGRHFAPGQSASARSICSACSSRCAA